MQSLSRQVLLLAGFALSTVAQDSCITSQGARVNLMTPLSITAGNTYNISWSFSGANDDTLTRSVLAFDLMDMTDPNNQLVVHSFIGVSAVDKMIALAFPVDVKPRYNYTLRSGYLDSRDFKFRYCYSLAFPVRLPYVKSDPCATSMGASINITSPTYGNLVQAGEPFNVTWTLNNPYGDQNITKHAITFDLLDASDLDNVTVIGTSLTNEVRGFDSGKVSVTIRRDAKRVKQWYAVRSIYDNEPDGNTRYCYSQQFNASFAGGNQSSSTPVETNSVAGFGSLGVAAIVGIIFGIAILVGFVTNLFVWYRPMISKKRVQPSPPELESTDREASVEVIKRPTTRSLDAFLSPASGTEEPLPLRRREDAAILSLQHESSIKMNKIRTNAEEAAMSGSSDPMQWSVQDVMDWAASVPGGGSDVVARLFGTWSMRSSLSSPPFSLITLKLEHGIDGSTLFELQEEHLKTDLGISKLANVIAFKRAIQALRPGGSEVALDIAVNDLPSYVP
ncbi:hypothetical protein BC830DRAFT_157964 [Chytriomyces sp. MP71]|nr:hypothetical protein BC830DRAFT_157964 [Chytriomyces sp. MP71]